MASRLDSRPPMKVYLVPASSTRFALYSEVAHADADAAAGDGSTLWGRMRASFRRAVDEGEAHQRGERTPDAAERGRFRRFITRKLAEAVAEQRLLWHIRHESQATLVHPDRVAASEAVRLARAEFTADYARHRRWLLIDAALVIVTGPLLFFVPGPNLVSWYFTFRAVGHFFSMKGARRGLTAGFFVPEASADLSAIADALDLARDQREARVAQAAEALGLERLAPFVLRIADRPR